MIERPSKLNQSTGKLLFIHGMCHGAWCWDKGFMQAFNELGYDCFAINLSKHENAGRARDINAICVHDYVKDVKKAIERIGEDTILIGHSMGGFVTQKYLEAHSVSKAILLGSVPPTGILPAATRYLLKHLDAVPSFLKRDIYAPFITHTSELYHPTTDQSLIEECKSLMCAESFKALVNMMFQPVKKPSKTPLLIIGAMEDSVISCNEVRSTAAFHGVTPILLEGLGHNMMLDKNYESVVNIVHEWLDKP